MSSAVRCLYDKEVRGGGRSQTSGLRVREAAMSGTIRYRPTLCHVSLLWLGPASVLSGRILLLRGCDDKISFICVGYDFELSRNWLYVIVVIHII